MTMEALISGLQNQGLRIPIEHLENVRRFTMTGQTERGKNRDDIPFERYVDIWWLALCLGIKEDRRTRIEAESMAPIRPSRRSTAINSLAPISTSVDGSW